jgi:hypothetical protein
VKLYMKKTWGYDNPSGPLQFSERGRMMTARDTLHPEDRRVFLLNSDLTKRGKPTGR